MTSAADPAPAPPRLVRSRMTMEVDDRTSFVATLAVSRANRVEAERLRLALDGEELPAEELAELHGTRSHVFEAGRGLLELEYSASVVDRAAPAPVDRLERIVYTRPSRYCESDSLTGLARETFGSAPGAELLRAVPEWVHGRLDYDLAGTVPGGTAQDTLAAGRGVCRDFAHLAISLFRALDTPARLVAVYAPRLEPMDFHAVVEVLVDDAWWVVDPTRLAPRGSMVRLATGRDAADTAFLTNTLSDIRLVTLEVDAEDAAAAPEDPDAMVQLS